MSIEAWVISILVFSIQIFIAFYLFNRSKRDRMPSWAFRSLKINQLYPEFHNEPIKELEEKEFATEKRQYVKRFILWNGGKNTIDKDDINKIRGIISANPFYNDLIDDKPTAEGIIKYHWDCPKGKERYYTAP